MYLSVIGVMLTGCKSQSGSQKGEQTVTQNDDVSVTARQSAPVDASATSVASGANDIAVSSQSVKPGTLITKKGVPLKLVGSPLELGEALPGLTLKNAVTGKDVSTESLIGKVLLISVVPAIATPVCTAQSTTLEKDSEALSKDVIPITISRDPEETLKHFAQSNTASHVLYLSDKASDTFGLATGLGIEGLDVLARAVIVVDKKGIVRLIQVVPEITHLPDMAKAIQVANDLADMPASSDTSGLR